MKTTVVEKLIRCFPELENEVNHYFEDFEEIYLHLIFGDIFNPYLSELLNEPQVYRSKLLKAGELLEDMSKSNTEIQEVVVATVLERLSDDPKQLRAFSAFAGECTKQFIADITDSFINPFAEE